MTKEDRISLLNDLVNEVTKDEFDKSIVKSYMERLRIPYSEDPMQLLNNVLKGIHVIEVPLDDKLV